MGLTSVVRSSEGLLVAKVGDKVGVAIIEDSDAEGCDEEDTKGTRRRVTSVRSRTLVPLPGINTRVAPLLVEEEPTAIPNSALGAYFQVRSVGGIAATGQPNGNRNLVEISGGFPVTISKGDKGKFSHSLVCGLQLAVWIHNSTA